MKIQLEEIHQFKVNFTQQDWPRFLEIIDAAYHEDIKALQELKPKIKEIRDIINKQ